MPRIIEGEIYNSRKLPHFLSTQIHPLFLQKSCAFSSSKGTSSVRFFSGNMDAFHGTEPRPQSMTCEDCIRGAREKHPVSTGTIGREIKPTPMQSARSI